MENLRETNELLSLDYDYLRIAHHHARLGEREADVHKAWDAVVVACVFGTFAVDAMFNDLWTIQRAATRADQRKVSGQPRSPEAWKRIESPHAWARKKPLEKIRLLTRAAADKEFFETGDTETPDLVSDFIALRHALVHAAPDTWWRRTRVVERYPDGGTRSEVLEVQDRTPEGRLGQRSLVCGLTPWMHLRGLGNQHAIDVVKVALALYHRANTLLWMPVPYVGFDGLQTFVSAYRALAPSPFDSVIENRWFAGK